MLSEGWESACEAVQGETNQITEKSSTDSWTTQEEEDYALNHFRSGIVDIIKAGKAVIPYRSTKTGHVKYIIITRNKVYKFPNNNVNYFNAAVQSVKYYGAESYFTSIGESSNAGSIQTTGNNFISNYNYTQ